MINIYRQNLCKPSKVNLKIVRQNSCNSSKYIFLCNFKFHISKKIILLLFVIDYIVLKLEK